MSIIDEYTCVWTDIIQSADSCEFTRQYCVANSIFNFYEMYYCSLNRHNWIFVPFAVTLTWKTFIDRYDVSMLLRTWLNSGRLPIPGACQHLKASQTLSVASYIF